MKTAKVAWILLGMVWLGVYLPLLAGRVAAFRDAYHFYYPLEYWLNQQAQQGDWFPQFNPRDGVGSNVVGEMTTGLFYPGRILYWVPMLDTAQRLGLVCLIHTAVAGLGAAYAARRSGLDVTAQLLAATAYSLSGPVLFQHVNPIYLVSAAWLPWALAECIVLAHGRYPAPKSRLPGAAPCVPEAVTMRWGVWITACSLTILAGDPQGTVHIGLITALAVIVAGWLTRSIRHLLLTTCQLIASVILVAGITAIQLLPTYHWYQATAASVVDVVKHPFPVVDVVKHPLPVVDVVKNPLPEPLPVADVVKHPLPVPHALADVVKHPLPELLQSMPEPAYDVARGSPFAYSVAPWHLATGWWSGLFGHVVPQNTRWISAWQAEPRMWVPSLSSGLVTMILALGGLCWKSLRQRTVFLWMVAGLAGTAMLGNYAPGWLLRMACQALGVSTAWLPGDAVGGTYWCLMQCIPGYEAFRYPAKWTPVLALALTLCAAHALEAWSAIQQLFQRCAGWFFWLTLVLVVTVSAVLAIDDTRAAIEAWIAQAAVDPWLGAVDSGAVGWTLITGLSLSLGVAWVAWQVVPRLPNRWQPWCLVGMVAFELAGCSQQWLVTDQPPKSPAAMAEGSHVLPRVWTGVGRANIQHDWPGSAGWPDPLRYQQEFMLGKLHLLSPQVANLSAFMTLTPTALARVRHRLAQHDRLDPDDPRLDEALAWLGVQWRLVRAAVSASGSASGSVTELRWQVVPGAGDLIELSGERSAQNTLHVKYFAASVASLEIDSSEATQLLVRLFQDGGWQAHLRSATGDQQRIMPQSSHLGLFQTLSLPAGRWEVELRYVAPGLIPGAWLSALTLLALIVYRACFTFWRSNRQTRYATDCLPAQTGP